MSRRPPSDGGSSRPTHLPGSCPGIGRQLAGVRAARQLSVEDVASRLLLSKAQVMGLEAGDAAAFYTSAYFLRGLRKYMAFAGVPDELLDLSPPDEEEANHPDGLRLTLATAAVEPATADIARRDLTPPSRPVHVRSRASPCGLGHSGNRSAPRT